MTMKSHLRGLSLLLCVSATIISSGCFVPKSRATELTTNNRALEEKNRALETRLLQAETDALIAQERLLLAERELGVFEDQIRLTRRQISMDHLVTSSGSYDGAGTPTSPEERATLMENPAWNSPRP